MGPSQAANDAAAVVKPTYFKKSLRELKKFLAFLYLLKIYQLVFPQQIRFVEAP